MANSPSDSPPGGGSFDPEEAERLAELFQASWEALPNPGGTGAPAAVAGSPLTAEAEPSGPRSGAEKNAGRRGAITVPEVPAANPKRTLLGIPAPIATVPVAAAALPSPLPNDADAARAANKRTLLGVAPPAPVRGPSQSQPPPVKVPSHAPPPPPPPPPLADQAEMAAWDSAAAPSNTTPAIPPAAKSSPRSSRPSGVAKAYVPKEDAHIPAIVVDEAALRDGEAAAAAEEARRQARAQASRSARTMRARPGELDVPFAPKRRTGLWVGSGLLLLAAIGGAALYGLQPDAPARTVTPEVATAAPPAAEAPIPVVPSPEALPVESAAPAEPPEATPEVSPADPGRPAARVQAKANAKPANRTNSPAKRSSDSPRPATAAESAKKAESSKKNVIVRDTPF
jgi:hypothetical protein